MIIQSIVQSVFQPIVRSVIDPIIISQGFSPKSLFSSGEQGAWYDPSDLSTMFQDSAGTTPVTGAGQVIGLIQDKSGNANHAFQDIEASKPILRNVLGLWWVAFDGVDDYLETKPLDFTNTNKLSGFFGLRKSNANPTSIFAELSVSSALNNGTFAIFAPPSFSPSLTFGSRARSDASLDNTSNPAFPIKSDASLSLLIDFAGFTNVLRVNGNQTSISSAPSAVNFGNNALYIGRRGGVAQPFEGRMYGLIVRGVQSDTASVLGAEGYMRSKSGVTL